jgi:hypothetical protein
MLTPRNLVVFNDCTLGILILVARDKPPQRSDRRCLSLAPPVQSVTPPPAVSIRKSHDCLPLPPLLHPHASPLRVAPRAGSSLSSVASKYQFGLICHAGVVTAPFSLEARLARPHPLPRSRRQSQGRAQQDRALRHHRRAAYENARPDEGRGLATRTTQVPELRKPEDQRVV